MKFLSFRLRTLFLLTLAVALVLGVREHLTVSFGYVPNAWEIVDGFGAVVDKRPDWWLSVQWDGRDLLDWRYSTEA